MADRLTGRWGYRLTFVIFAIILIFLQLLPLHPGPGRLPGADVLLLIALSWTVFNPAIVPVWLVAGVFLMSDLLLMRPPGLWAALAVLACEFARNRRMPLRTAPFFVEWLLVAGIVAGMTVANTLILSIFAVPQPTFGLTVIRLIFTILAYPLVVLFLGRALGLSKTGEDRDILGARG
ncbi:MAG: rod shape-determining protein MreD [Pseudomonadota bacterium]